MLDASWDRLDSNKKTYTWHDNYVFMCDLGCLLDSIDMISHFRMKKELFYLILRYATWKLWYDNHWVIVEF
jgi:hypothetical protein